MHIHVDPRSDTIFRDFNRLVGLSLKSWHFQSPIKKKDHRDPAIGIIRCIHPWPLPGSFPCNLQMCLSIWLNLLLYCRYGITQFNKSSCPSEWLMDASQLSQAITLLTITSTGILTKILTTCPMFTHSQIKIFYINGDRLRISCRD